jgi:hypothetical protein
MEDMHTLSTRIAAALLLQKGEITLKDIEAIPFVDSHETAFAIAARLARNFDVETLQVSRGRENSLDPWDDVIRLKTPAQVA